ncbi:MAG: sugar phosphate isomerase/epimerase [Planctomycetaceae bacterium]|nr:sugar phosphate isomerase/epimerase [Planctomycetaceae bacterium]
MSYDRRNFLCQSAALLGAASLPTRFSNRVQAAIGDKCRLGLVTYLWGEKLTLPELIEVCEQSQVLGLELRTTHRHGVERDLNLQQRRDVKARLADSPVTLVGIGSNERYDDRNPAKVEAAIQATKDFIILSQQVGGSGVKVKGDRFHDNVPREKTLAQVGAALHEIGQFGAEHGQEIRLEVHGGFSEIPIHAAVIEAADHKNVRTCWNSNRQDLDGKGLRANFNLVKDYFGKTAHIRALKNKDYPFAKLIELFVQMNYDGWLLLEARGDVKPHEVADRLSEQKAIFEQYIASAQQKLAR